MGLFDKLFGKKENLELSEANKRDRDLVEKNSKMMETLIILAEGADDFVAELKTLKNEMNFLTWSTKEEVYAHDKKIAQAIEELKKELADCCGEKARRLLRDLKVLVAERNSLV